MDFEGPVVIHGSSTSPFVRKVRLACVELGVAHRFVLAPPWSPTSGVERLNPLQKVPVLELADGRRLVDSRVILRYLGLRVPSFPLLPADPAAAIAMLELEAVADGVGDAGALTVQEGWRREDARSAVWLARQRHKIESGLRFLDHALPGAAGTAGGGDTPSLFDLAAASACGFVRFWLKDLDLPALAPALAARCAVLEQRPGWAATAPVLVPGAGVPAL